MTNSPLKILLPIDGSECATRAAIKLVECLPSYKERPTIEVLTVHLPVPRLPRASTMISQQMIDDYYDEECVAMLAPARRVLDAAGVSYSTATRIGPIAENIVAAAVDLGADTIWMGSHGRSAVANMVLGSVATRVLHLTTVPVLLVR